MSDSPCKFTTQGAGENTETEPWSGLHFPVSHCFLPENFSAIWVEASHGAHIFEEGQNVTLKCEASSTPASVAWSWERLDKKRVWQEVDTEKQLVLSRMEDSGEYRCRGHSEILNVTRKSPAYQVYFFSIPNSGR